MLPYGESFRFVDEIADLTNDGIVGLYTFNPSLGFYQDHFKEQPVTPGVILTECCAQIGLACFGIHLLNYALKESMMALTSSEMQYYHPVFPGERVKVIAEKEYFRFGKLKVKVKMYNEADKLICKGVLSGMLKTTGA